MLARTLSAAIVGVDGSPVRVDVDVAFGLPGAVQAPPSQAETDALKAQLKAGMDRWRSLKKFSFEGEDELRAAFRAACWQGYSDIIAAWTRWLNALVMGHSRMAEREELRALLCISPSGKTSPSVLGTNNPQPWRTHRLAEDERLALVSS
jgi:hypothetical protein